MIYQSGPNSCYFLATQVGTDKCTFRLTNATFQTFVGLTHFFWDILLYFIGTMAQWHHPIVTNNRLLHPKGKHIHFIQIISNYFHKPLNRLGPQLFQGFLNSDFCQLLPPSFLLLPAQQAQGHVETWSLEKRVPLKDLCRLTEPRNRKKGRYGKGEYGIIEACWRR